MSRWLLPKKELSAEQINAIELDPAENRIIFGPPGSGKTQVLLYRACFLRDRWNVQPSRFRIFVYTKVLKNYIQSALNLLDIPQECCTNWDAWCYQYYRDNIKGKVPRIKDGRENSIPDFDQIRVEILKSLKDDKKSADLFDFIMIDEGQDLSDVSFELMCRITSHVTACADYKQQIFERGAAEEVILNRLHLPKRNMILIQGFRCNPYVAELAAQFIEKAQDKLSFMQQAKRLRVEQDTPLIYYAYDYEGEKRNLLDILKVRQLKNESIAIIFPYSRMVYGFAKGMREEGFEVEDKENLDFNSNAPKLLTYQGAKGLTFDTVLMPRLEPRYFSHFDESMVEKLLFVAISRARKWVYLSTTRSRSLPALKKLEALVENQSLIKQIEEKDFGGSKQMTIFDQDVDKSKDDFESDYDFDVQDDELIDLY